MNQADQDGVILPPQTLERAWGRDHLRLHRHLRRQPQLLPPGASLLLAVSGGQDSMALLALLLGLRRLHGWRLQLWHGDHRWRPEAAQQADALAGWCRDQGLSLTIDARDQPGPASTAHTEAQARAWRYERLEAQALALGCSHVVCGHTASDRAETLLLHLARGSHRRGLASLRPQRALGSSGLQLSRPLLIFDRSDTGRICQELQLPVWLDPSNSDLRYSRNRLRQAVLPELEALHPGAARRLSATAERLAREHDAQQDWLTIALHWLAADAGGLDRIRLAGLQRVNQTAVLELWLSTQLGCSIAASQLDGLVERLQQGREPGRCDLAAGWQLHWDRSKLVLVPPEPADR
jgi:tRNA(Ile)-lysidine synthase